MAWLLLMFGGLTVPAEAQEIITAAASPYELAKFVETHNGFDWSHIWNALHITDAEIFLPPCEEDHPGVPPCAGELITIVDPFQVIVVLEHRISMFQVFLRYQKVGADGWRFSSAYAPLTKYFRPEHRITRFGGKQFLIVTG